MADELWNAKLTHDNLRDFYLSTVVMVYSSVLQITKESTRCENAIVKSYLDIYSRRTSVPADKVIYVFGDILLDNARKVVEDYPLPADITYPERLLDEYTRNSMLEKIMNKIDSKSFKMVEFISSDMKKGKSGRGGRRMSNLFTVTPLLCFEVIVLALIIAAVSYAAVTLPYSKKQLIDEQAIFENSSVQEKYIAAMAYFPLNAVTDTAPADSADAAVAGQDTADTTTETASADTAADPAQTTAAGNPAPVIATTAEPKVSATSG